MALIPCGTIGRKFSTLLIELLHKRYMSMYLYKRKDDRQGNIENTGKNEIKYKKRNVSMY